MVQVCEASVASQYIVLFEETSRSENSFFDEFHQDKHPVGGDQNDHTGQVCEFASPG